MEEIFDIDNFNIIEDEENYYFFRALNMADNKDLKEGKIIDSTGRIEKIRSDRERYEENSENGAPKYSKDAEISLEQAYDHIKENYRKDTNCISLSSNCNVSILYGRGSYKDIYIMVKVPKNKFGKKVFVAGQYLLKEIAKRIDKYISSLNSDNRLLQILDEIDNSKTLDEMIKAIETRYTSKGELDVSKAKPRRGITYKAPTVRISNWQALNKEQSLERNKIIAKLTLIERVGKMQPIIPDTSNNNKLVRTIENAFSSLELIHYGEIEKKEIINIQKEIVDIFALIQQIHGQNPKVVRDVKREVIRFVNEGKIIEIPENSALLEDYKIRDNMEIDRIPRLAEEKEEYGKNSSEEKIFYLEKSKTGAKEFAKIIRKIVGDNPKYSEIIQYISENGYRVEPSIITNQNNHGVKLSEAISLDLNGT